MSKPSSYLLLILAVSDDLLSQNIIKEPEPSGKPGAYQLAQIKRKYGMFIHFGINTFFDEEWTDGSKPPAFLQTAFG
jgi:alpha-L-fucosidase